MHPFRSKYFYIIVIIFIFVINSIVIAEPKIDKEIKAFSFLAYSEFAQEYVSSGKIITATNFVWLDTDNVLSVYESGKLYQYDNNLDLKNSIELKDLELSKSGEKDSTKQVQLQYETLKIISIPGKNQSYFLQKIKYTTKEKDFNDLQEKITELKSEEKDHLYSLQTLASEEQKEKNKLSAQKASSTPSIFVSQMNEIKKNYVEKRNELEKKIIKLFSKQKDLELKISALKNKEFIVEIRIFDIGKNIEIKSYIFPDNFWGINIFDMELITTDTNGLFYGYRKKDSRIYAFDDTGELLLSFIIDNPDKILVDKNQNIYILSPGGITQFKPFGFTKNFISPSVNNLNMIGSITEESTWSGTVTLTGETRVEDGAILNILPGTKIIFSKSSTAKLNVYGTIKAIGKKNAYIIFTSDTPYPFGEVSVYSDEKQESSIISFCRFESMQYALRIYDSSPEITHCIFINNEDGVWYQGTNSSFATKCRIVKNTFKDNLVGVLITFLNRGTNPTIE
ncbi:hypothetical protein HY745_08225, partial [Candidatus Desantisbacteria bacterium]|nr:hypothetical protein [Candidatus Desantisbacteria bacterium]